MRFLPVIIGLILHVHVTSVALSQEGLVESDFFASEVLDVVSISGPSLVCRTTDGWYLGDMSTKRWSRVVSGGYGNGNLGWAFAGGDKDQMYFLREDQDEVSLFQIRGRRGEAQQLQEDVAGSYFSSSQIGLIWDERLGLSFTIDATRNWVDVDPIFSRADRLVTAFPVGEDHFITLGNRGAVAWNEITKVGEELMALPLWEVALPEIPRDFVGSTSECIWIRGSELFGLSHEDGSVQYTHELEADFISVSAKRDCIIVTYSTSIEVFLVRDGEMKWHASHNLSFHALGSDLLEMPNGDIFLCIASNQKRIALWGPVGGDGPVEITWLDYVFDGEAAAEMIAHQQQQENIDLLSAQMDVWRSLVQQVPRDVHLRISQRATEIEAESNSDRIDWMISELREYIAENP